MSNRRIGLGPVFVYEWITSSRRWQAYAQRSLFVSVLLIVLLNLWLNMETSGSAIRDQAILGRRFFLGLIGTQLALVLLAAPAATAGAICVDRARGTLMHMLVTDLSVGEIVLGKLAARLAPVLLMIACTLPVLEILTLLGGVDPNAILGALIVTVGVAVLSCSLAMTLSLWVGKTHQALLCTYAVLFLWLLAGPMIKLLASTIGWPWPAPPLSSEPFFLALAPYWSPGKVGWVDYVLFLAVTVSIAALLTGVAILRFRSVCTREFAHTARRSRSLVGGGSIWRPLSNAVLWLNPSLDGNPVVWRECRRSPSSRWTMVIAIAYAGLSILFSVVSVLWSSVFARAVVNGAQVSVGLLLLGVTAASSLAEERANGGLDVLLSTPLSARQIVIGKWLGALRIVPLLAVMPAFVIWASGPITNSELAWEIALMIAFVLCAGAAITSVGMAMATRFSRPGRAALSAVAVWVLVTVGWPILASMMMGPRGERLMMGSPILWATCATGLEPGGASLRWLWELFWALFYGLSAVGVLFATVTSFDRRLGRLDSSLARLCIPSRMLQAITAIYFGWGTFFTLFLLCAPPDSILLPLGTGLLFSLGLLVLALRGAWPVAGARVKSEGAEPGADAGRLPLKILAAKWAVAGRVLPWVVLLPSTTAFCATAQSWLDWARFLVVFGFVLAVCLVVVSLGVAMFQWCRGGVRAVILMTVLWGLTNIGWIALGRVGFRHQFDQARTSGDPFFDLATLILWTNEISANDFRALAWIVGASMGYGVAGGLLVLVAQWRGGLAIGRPIRSTVVSPSAVMIHFPRREGQA
jgi:ABC-type transport system involved in multi-copper enzyme maturation permease subunit